MVFTCCVPSCLNTNQETKMHSFPYRDPHVYSIWIDRIGNKKLHNMDPAKVNQNYRVCDAHFSDFSRLRPQFCSRSNLIKRALPTLHLSNFTELPSKHNSVLWLKNVEAQNIANILDHNIEFDIENQQTETAVPSTSIAVPSTSTAVPSTSTAVEQILDIPNMHGIITPERSATPIMRTPKSRKDLTHRINILKLLNVSRQSCLTPKAKKMYRMMVGIRKVARRLDMQNASMKKRLQAANNVNIELMEKNTNTITCNFFKSQLRLQKVKPRGRRFTLEDKVFALSLIKCSPKCYKLLAKVFALPSRRTLTGLLNAVPFRSGINSSVMSQLKYQIRNLKKSDRYCVLLFDEMALQTGLSYNKRADLIEGFQDCGGVRKPEFADHVMVFMARGIKKKWKQPISYYFVKNNMSAPLLKETIKSNITELQAIGLVVVATVCDQLQVNCKVINSLIEDTKAEFLRKDEEYRGFGFYVNNVEVIPFYDPPHLLKGIRNNFINKKVKFIWKQGQQVASWEHLKILYELDLGVSEDYRMCARLTENHIYAEKMKKMKVNIACQIFSQRVSSVMSGLIRYGAQGMPQSASNTADFLLFIDKVFDSVNGAAVYPVHGKYLRCAVTSNSLHREFWREAIKVFQTMEFFSESRSFFIPPTVKNWIWSLKAFGYLWDKLEKTNFKFLCPRQVNQDPLENFFGCIRSLGVRNINPTCTSFIPAFKTLIINNFAAPHSPGFNCEEDDCHGALDTLQKFVIYNSNSNHSNDETVEVNVDMSNSVFEELSPIGCATFSYIAGFVARKIKRKIKTCEHCLSELISATEENEHFLISSRAYTHKALLYPNTNFAKQFRQTCFLLSQILPKICHETNVRKKLISITHSSVSANFTCKIHTLKDLFISTTVDFYIITWVKNINKTLKGADEYSETHYNDPIRRMAKDRYKKYKKKQEMFKAAKGLV